MRRHNSPTTHLVTAVLVGTERAQFLRVGSRPVLNRFDAFVAVLLLIFFSTIWRSVRWADRMLEWHFAEQLYEGDP